ncbi:hypothetical protein NDQ57_12045, partial [Rossellomorea marisflavi]|uniref:hypothetical protein n=1 Tax=Rossellomorea marisflavi TaxID=189381 RepID=UPI0020402BA5
MGRAVSRFGTPARSPPARYSHRSREASVTLHSVRRRGDVMIGNMGIAILFCNEYVVERRPF